MIAPRVAALALVLGGAVPGRAELPSELAWLPKDAALVMAFDTPEAPGRELFDRFRAELLFAAGLDQRIQDFTALVGGEAAPDIRRLVVALSTAPSKPFVAIAVAPVPEGLRASLRSSGKLVPRAEDAPEIDAVRVKDGEAEWGIAFLGEDRVGFGDVALLRECLERRRGSGRPSVLDDPSMMARIREAAVEADAWIVAGAEWLGFAGAPPASGDTRGQIVNRSLAGIRAVTASARVGTEVRFTMRTAAGRDEDAVVLADTLRSFLASLRLGGNTASPLYRSLESARVTRRGPSIALEMSFSPEAMQRLRKDESSPRLLKWRLGAEERERRQRIGELLDALEVTEGSRVADVGAGGGFLTVRLAQAVGPRGRVFAEDIGEKTMAALRQRVAEAPFENIDVITGAPDDPKLPAALDAVLIVNSYHEMPEHAAMLERIREALQPGGRLVLVEPYSPARRTEPRERQEKDHIIAPELVDADLRLAGYEVVRRDEHFIQHADGKGLDWLIVARRPGPR